MTGKGGLRTALRSTAVYTIGLLLQRFISLLLLPLYTSYIPPADYAILDTLDTTVAVFGIIFGARFTAGLFYYYANAKTEAERGRVINTGLIGGVLFGISAGLVGIAGAPWISLLAFGSEAYARPVQIMLASFALTIPAEVGWGWLRSENRAVLFVVCSLVQMILLVALNLIFIVQLGWGYQAVLWTSLFSGCTLVAAFVLSARFARPGSFSMSLFWEMCKFSAPLGFVALAGFVFHSADRFLLVRFVPLAEMGEYALAYKIGMLASLTGTAFNQYWSANIYSHIQGREGPRELARVFTYVAAAVTYASFAIWAVSLPVLSGITARSYHGAIAYVPWLLLPYWIRVLCDLLRGVFWVHKRTSLDARVNMQAAALCLLAYLILIPWLGVWGAVIATNIGFFALFAACWHAARGIMPLPLEWGRLARLSGVTLVLGWTVMLQPLVPWLGQAALAVSAVALFPALLAASGFLNVEEQAILRSLWNSLRSRLRLVTA